MHARANPPSRGRRCSWKEVRRSGIYDVATSGWGWEVGWTTRASSRRPERDWRVPHEDLLPSVTGRRVWGPQKPPRRLSPPEMD